MEKYSNRDDLIAALTEEVTPIKRVRSTDGMALLAFATIIACLMSVAIYEWWDGLLSGEASGYFLITHGLLLLLGAASGAGLVNGALPRVGAQSSAALWGALMVGVLPVGAALSLLAGHGNHAHEGLNDPVASMCVIGSLSAAAIVMIASVLWLRRGAPVSIERSGWLTGLAAGALGTLAYGITCPLDTFSHVGIWHVVPVGISALVGRFVVPPLIRW